jgi:diguanylate cyclase (GGDEF)-like protein
MRNHEKNFDLSSQSLRDKLNIAFALMSLLPLLVCMYVITNYILPRFNLCIDITLSVLISIFTAIIGFFVLKRIFNRILSITSEAKLIAAGDIDRKVDTTPTDEMSELGQALNQLTQNIRNNMDELRSYGQKTTEINFEIQKRMLALSNLLQISSLITQGANLEEVLKLALEKSRLLADSDVAYLLFRDEEQDTFFVKVADGINTDYLFKVKVEPDRSIFNKAVKTNRTFILDKQEVVAEELKNAFYDDFRLKNTLAQPVYLKGRVMALLCIGNSKDNFLYSSDDIELLDIFAKQVAIAVGNDILIRRINKLEIKDSLTGLYNELFIRNYLQDEIRRAITYQRPCGFMLLNIDNFTKYNKNFGSVPAEGALKKIASLIRESVSEIDRVARIGDNEFAIVLPEKNKRKVEKIADDIRKKIEFSFSEEGDPSKRLTISGGLSENPLDGVNAEELFNKAREALKIAKREGKNRISPA